VSRIFISSLASSRLPSGFLISKSFSFLAGDLGVFLTRDSVALLDFLGEWSLSFFDFSLFLGGDIEFFAFFDFFSSCLFDLDFERERDLLFFSSFFLWDLSSCDSFLLWDFILI
jgi:hypothetical protein